MIQKEKTSAFLMTFQFVYVVFFLYLLADIFYRWDGFSYHAPFSDFIPSLALIITLWNVVVLLVSALIWLCFRVVERLFSYKGLKIKLEHWLILLAAIPTLLAGAWKAKRLFFNYGLDSSTKLLVGGYIVLVSILIA